MIGIYSNIHNTCTLTGLETDDAPEELHVKEGCVALAENIFSEFTALTKLILPSTLQTVPDGCFSNGGGWASDETGISEILLDENNPFFTCFDGFFCKKETDDTLKLIRYLGGSKHVVLPGSIKNIGEKAFCGRKIGDVYLEGSAQMIPFPKSHLYYLDILLEDFGKNGQLYDFTRYDHFLFQDHFNTERIRMACARMKHPDLPHDRREELLRHLKQNEESILEAVAKDPGTDSLDLLAEAGFFDKENMDECIEAMEKSDRKDLLSWMINYKHDHFGIIEFDFEI